MLLFIAFLILVACLVVKNNSCGKFCLLKSLEPILCVVPSLLFAAYFNLFTC